MSAMAMEKASLPAGVEPSPAAADCDMHQAAQDAVNRALDSAQHLLAEMRSARFAALARHARSRQA